MATCLELLPSTDSVLIGGKNILLLRNLRSEKKVVKEAEKKDIIYAGVNPYFKSLYIVHR